MFSFLKSVFSEDGQGSYSRCGSAFIVLATIVWITYLVVKNKVMPDLGPPTMFMSVGTGVHYGTNKATDIIDSIKGKTNG